MVFGDIGRSRKENKGKRNIMIEISIRNDGMTIEGHAPREHGRSENLVCAAVSALAQTIIDGMEEIAGADIQRIKQESGNISIRWDGLNEIATALMKTFVLGVENIAFSHPGTIEIKTLAIL